VLQDVPVQLILDSCDLFVHHGGGNCVLNGASAGVPQLALSIGLDQHVNGQRLVATGAGAQLRGDQVTVARLRQAVAALLADDSYRVAAQRLRGQVLAAPSPADLVSSLEQVVAGGPGQAP
jgi:UDP:flavonoid glycosyltransferase YjiC (YdhE family)